MLVIEIEEASGTCSNIYRLRKERGITERSGLVCFCRNLFHLMLLLCSSFFRSCQFGEHDHRECNQDCYEPDREF